MSAECIDLVRLGIHDRLFTPPFIRTFLIGTGQLRQVMNQLRYILVEISSKKPNNHTAVKPASIVYAISVRLLYTMYSWKNQYVEHLHITDL